MEKGIKVIENSEKRKTRIRLFLLTLGFAFLYLATFDSDMGSPDERQRYQLGLVWLGTAGVIAAGLTLFLLWFRLGSLKDMGYGNETFSFDLLYGLHGLLLGWGRSIFIYTPFLILAVLGLPRMWRRFPQGTLAILSTLIVSLLIIASWWCWWGQHPVDGDARTRWHSNRKRLDGMWVELKFNKFRTDILRLDCGSGTCGHSPAGI